LAWVPAGGNFTVRASAGEIDATIVACLLSSAKRRGEQAFHVRAHQYAVSERRDRSDHWTERHQRKIKPLDLLPIATGGRQQTTKWLR
jgi:hypothetical protein